MQQQLALQGRLHMGAPACNRMAGCEQCKIHASICGFTSCCEWDIENPTCQELNVPVASDDASSLKTQNACSWKNLDWGSSTRGGKSPSNSPKRTKPQILMRICFFFTSIVSSLFSQNPRGWGKEILNRGGSPSPPFWGFSDPYKWRFFSPPSMVWHFSGCVRCPKKTFALRTAGQLWHFLPPPIVSLWTPTLLPLHWSSWIQTKIQPKHTNQNSDQIQTRSSLVWIWSEFWFVFLTWISLFCTYLGLMVWMVWVWSACGLSFGLNIMNLVNFLFCWSTHKPWKKLKTPSYFSSRPQKGSYCLFESPPCSEGFGPPTCLLKEKLKNRGFWYLVRIWTMEELGDGH